MNVDIDLPQVALLREAVSKQLGMTPRLLTDFSSAADRIATATGEKLSPSTMERFWAYSTRTTRSVAEHTLDVLSRYVGYDNWPHFYNTVADNWHPDSGFVSGETIDISSLEPGMLLRLSWLPDRVIKVRYCGENKFVVEHTLHSSMKKGDTFECLVIQKGQPLYLDRYRRIADGPDGHCSRYVVGRTTGLVSVELLRKNNR